MKHAIKNTHKKFTVLLPEDMVNKAVRLTGGSVRFAIEMALREMTHARASNALLAMRGKLDLGVNLKALRED